MMVEEIMNKNVATCMSNDDVVRVAARMRSRDCGFVPVVNEGGAVVGVITDRDVCLAVASKPTLSHAAVKDVMSQPVFTCFPQDTAIAAMATMVKHRVRRLPVLDKTHGHMKGVLSLDDLAGAPRRRGAPTNDDVAETLRALSARRPLLSATPTT